MMEGYLMGKQGMTLKKGMIETTPDGAAVIPAQMEAETVCGIDAYAFSGEGNLRAVFLPDTIEEIGAYAFYDCEALSLISVPDSIRDLGAGVFTGCKSISRLDVRVMGGKRSCLKELLSEIRQTLRVNLCGGQTARLVFPGYYEEAVENTPARITSTHTHGCGHRYRYSVTKEGVSFREYDSILPYIRVQEPEGLVAELALGRLMHPWGLSEEARSAYASYLNGHLQAAMEVLAERGRVDGEWARLGRQAGVGGFGREEGLMDSIRWLAMHCVGQKGDFDEMIQAAGRLGLVEAVSLLMDLSRERFCPGRRAFAL